MKLQQTLRQAGIIPNARVIYRVAELKGLLGSGRLPEDILRKLKLLPEHQSRQTLHLHILARALCGSYASGNPLPEPLNTLAHYSLAYLWEENDEISDDGHNGLTDDLRVTARVAKHAKNELDTLVLKSRRHLIQERWSYGHAAIRAF